MTLLEKIVVECVVFSDGTTNASLRLHETEKVSIGELGVALITLESMKQDLIKSFEIKVRKKYEK